MKVFVRRFGELSTEQLYAILRLRVAVFVVEQQCPYQELDGRDQAAIHVWLEDAEGVAACLRVMDRGVESEHVSIGRVVTARRRQGLGSRVMAEGIRAARQYFGAGSIYLEAQVYAKPFYEQLGFRQISGEFLEDGIPHIRMLLEPIAQEGRMMKTYAFYGWQEADVREAHGLTPRDLYDLLCRCWQADTCAPRMRSGWTPENRTLGQCSITAFLVQDLYGGRVLGVPLGDGNFHCFNEVDGCVFDLTSEQFGSTVLDYAHCPEQSREKHFAKEEKRARYELLKARLEELLPR